MTDGSYIGFKYFDFLGNDTLTLNVIAYNGGEIRLYNDLEAEPCGCILLKSSEGIVESYKVETKIRKGTAPLFFKYTGDGVCDVISFELN